MSAVATWGWFVALAVPVALLVAHGRRAELVARACHELAGPLQAADLALHAARRETGGGPRLAAVDLELRRAALALDDLDAARAGRRAADADGLVDLGSLLAQQVLTWQVAAADRGRRLQASVDSGLQVRGDAVRLAQAVSNLLANAVEHGDGTIELRASRAGGRVRVEVRDGGAGLPAPVAELARRPRAGRGSRGRGLAIAAEIAVRHGGRLAAAPSPAGACLALELPAQRRAA